MQKTIYDIISVGDKVYDIATRKHGVVKEKRADRIVVRMFGAGTLTLYTVDGRLAPNGKKVRLVTEEPKAHKEARLEAERKLNEKADSFKSELKALLEKYDATIDFDVDEGSDTHGIYGGNFSVSFNSDGKSVNLSKHEGSWALTQGDLG